MTATRLVRVLGAMDSAIAPGTRMVILADGHLDVHFGKTALGLLRYREADVVAVIERSMAGRHAGEALGVGGNVPIVASLEEALTYHPSCLVIGVATRGGAIPPEWMPVLQQAVGAGLDLVSGLHQFLNDDPNLASRAESVGVRLVDVRNPPVHLSVAELRPRRAGTTVVTLVGSDCAVGKMSVALDIESLARRRGIDAYFLATGQTGMMIAGNGIPLDRVIGDFMSGAMEQAVTEVAAAHDIILVEGQGSLIHPAYSGVTLALIHGSQPDALILTVMPGRATIEDYEIPIPPVTELIKLYEAAAGWLKSAPVIGIAVNSHGLNESEAKRAIARVESETGLPATDTFLFGAGPLVDAIDTFHYRRHHPPIPWQERPAADLLISEFGTEGR